jgi:hypothetical protein
MKLLAFALTGCWTLALGAASRADNPAPTSGTARTSCATRPTRTKPRS